MRASKRAGDDVDRIREVNYEREDKGRRMEKDVACFVGQTEQDKNIRMQGSDQVTACDATGAKSEEPGARSQEPGAQVSQSV
ncbi:hypothetical protein VM1G_10165 [Cytospora mali]|uniref:Uncharacterized protein n=1 Tax=Cytospora mali TaxID=578113 RepID=A0A194WE66_CYTMA|nr:hypothetical protein VM1G_10165 [Valsa mali]